MWPGVPTHPFVSLPPLPFSLAPGVTKMAYLLVSINESLSLTLKNATEANKFKGPQTRFKSQVKEEAF